MPRSTRPLVTKLTVFYACQLKATTERYLEKTITKKNNFFTNLPTDLTQSEFVSLQVIGVAQIINKKSGMHQFTEKDEEVSTLAQPLARYQPAGFQNSAEDVENVLRRFCFSSS